jgi:SAM-dependent methyltransferase
MASVSASSPSAASKRRKRPPLRIRLCLSSQRHHQAQAQQQQQQQKHVFKPGDRVYYRSKSANTPGACGTVVAAPDDDAVVSATNGSDKKRNNKCSVLFDGEESSTNSQQQKCRQVSTRRLLPIYNNNTASSAPHDEIAVFVTDETNRFRQLAVSQIQGTASSSSSSSSRTSSSSASAHRVLEIGCSTGETSAILWRQQQQQRNNRGDAVIISSWVGLDTSAEMIEIVQKKMSSETMMIMSSSRDDDAGSSSSSSSSSQMSRHCQRVDALVDPRAAIQAACVFHAHGPTMVFVDIGGNREEVGVLRMLQFLLLNAPFPDLHQIIIKSRALCQSLMVDNKITFFKANAGGGRDDFGGDDDDGFVVERVDAWLEAELGRLSTSLLPELPRHPQKAPIRYCPVAPNSNDKTKTPICRYHNYHKNGCHKTNESCPFDHVHCHFCLQPGHKALDCAHASSVSSGNRT